MRRFLFALAFIAVFAGTIPGKAATAYLSSLEVRAAIVTGKAGANDAAVLVMRYAYTNDAYRTSPSLQHQSAPLPAGTYGCIWMTIRGRRDMGCAWFPAQQFTFADTLSSATARFSVRSASGRRLSASISMTGESVPVAAPILWTNYTPQLPIPPTWLYAQVATVAQRSGKATGTITGGRRVGGTMSRTKSILDHESHFWTNAYPTR
jgi:hypothetical protein